MSLNKWYEKGITPETYMGALEKHKEGFSYVYDNIDLSTFEKDEEFFQFVKEKNLRAIAIAEVWCGHCMLNVPILLRLAEKTNMSVRLLPRDENLELMDQYLTNGKSRSIPIFIFIDESGKEVAKWGPITETVKQFVNENKVNLPDKEAANYDEKFTEFINIVSESLRENGDFWRASYEDIKQALLDIDAVKK